MLRTRAFLVGMLLGGIIGTVVSFSVLGTAHPEILPGRLVQEQDLGQLLFESSGNEKFPEKVKAYKDHLRWTDLTTTAKQRFLTEAFK